MIQKKIICDRCEKVIFDSEHKPESKSSDLVDMLFGTASAKDIGYVEMNVMLFDGTVANTIHLCENCYDIATQALNKKE